MADFQAKICEKFNIQSLTDNQSKYITAIIDGKDVFVGTTTGSVKRVLIGCSYYQLHYIYTVTVGPRKSV